MSEYSETEDRREIIKQKLRQYYDGRIVRKDLTKSIREGANVPVYVLEYLLGQYCNSDDPEIIDEGVDNVKRILRDNYVRPDEAQKILSLLRERGSYTVIDRIVTNSFAASSGNSEDNGSILNYGLGAFVEEKEFCPKCKNHMILAKNARGTAYLKCSNKACKETKYLTVDLMNWYINSHNIKCPKRDGGELKGGLGKYGPYVRCNCGHFLKPDEI